ncbi:MAG: AMP-binding protein, partial [Nocardioidaceae bacterium]
HALAIAAAYDLSDGSRVLQFASPSFDVAAEEVFPTLIAGGAVVVGPAAVPSVAELLRYVATSAIDVVNLPTAYWHEWVRELPSGALPPSCLRLVVIGTEAAAPEHVQAWRRLVGAHPRLFNAYGPTETTITALVMPSPADPAGPPGSLPIGRPIANVRVYVLDRFLQPVPTGVAGELYVAGAGVARGYHNQPGLTSRSFVPDPFEPGARMYRTGDLVRHLPGGNLEFLGRRDTQVKIRGHRIELGEIEHALRSHPDVREAAVAVDGASSGGRRLLAYVACGSGDRSDPDHAHSGDTEQIAGWRTVYDEIYRQDAEPYEPAFNIVGWNSTYTGLPLPRTEMREWLDATVEAILSLRPRRVLEIGCGTGMVLFAVAPHCERYVGTDFSPVALD